jgi:signal transduction histidine kinase
MVVGNLVDNAGKHAPPGTPIQVTVDQPEGLTRIQVTDGGEGVAEIDRERIFAPFTQLDASTTRRVGGVGLGLFLVGRLVRGMGARSGWRTPGGGAASWSSCPTWPRYRIAPPAPGTAGAVEASKPV